MPDPPYWLDRDSRATVLAAIKGHFASRRWSLLTAHVRTNHVYAVVEAEVQPEKIMNEFKSYAGRELNLLHPDEPAQRRRARHGSPKWLRKDHDVQEAIRYVAEEQGEPMALFISEETLPCGRGSA
jgi:hypothetical protein